LKRAWRRHGEVAVDQATDGLEPLRTVKINEAIQERLVRFIRERKLMAGDKLPSEGALAQKLGVSRGTLREAMRSLQAVGIVEARVGSGWYVRDFSLDPIAMGLSLTLEPDQDTFRDLNEIRTGLEWLFVAQAIPTLSTEDVDSLEQAVIEMEALAQAGHSYFAQDRYFHEQIFAKVPNQVLARVMDLFWMLCASIAPRLDLVSQTEHVVAAGEHRLLLEAIRAGDVERARAILFGYFQQTISTQGDHS